MVNVRPITLKEYFPNTVILYNWLDKIPKDILKYNIYKFLTCYEIVELETSKNLPRNFLTNSDIENEKKYQDTIDNEDKHYFNLPLDPYYNYTRIYQNVDDFPLLAGDKTEKTSDKYKDYIEEYEKYIEYEKECEKYEPCIEDYNDNNDDYENMFEYEYLEYLDRKYMDYIES